MALDRNLVIRTLSGIVMLVVVLGAVLVSPYTMATLFVLLTIGAQWEFYKIAQLTGAAPLQVYPTILGALLVVGGVVSFAIVRGAVYNRIVPQKLDAFDQCGVGINGNYVYCRSFCAINGFTMYGGS